MSHLRLAYSADDTPKAKQEAFTAIPNDILDALLSADLTGRELKIALAVVRKTIGFNKPQDDCTISQLGLAAGIDRAHASRAFHAMVDAKIINASAGKYGYLVSINPVSEWQISTENTPCQNSTNVPKRHARTCQNGTHNRQPQKTIDSSSLRSEESLPISQHGEAERPAPKLAAVKSEPSQESVGKTKPSTKPAAVEDPRFAEFWNAFGYKHGKAGAAEAFRKINPSADTFTQIIAAARNEAARRNPADKSPKWAQGWLNERRFEDEALLQTGWTDSQKAFVAAWNDRVTGFVPIVGYDETLAASIDAWLLKKWDVARFEKFFDYLQNECEFVYPSASTVTVQWVMRPENFMAIKGGKFQKGGKS